MVATERRGLACALPALCCWRHYPNTDRGFLIKTQQYLGALRSLLVQCLSLYHFFFFFLYLALTQSIWKFPGWGWIRATAVSLHHGHSNVAAKQHPCDLHHGSQWCWLLNPPSAACILMDTRQFGSRWATKGTPPDVIFTILFKDQTLGVTLFSISTFFCPRMYWPCSQLSGSLHTAPFGFKEQKTSFDSSRKWILGKLPLPFVAAWTSWKEFLVFAIRHPWPRRKDGY